jgi:ribosomal protein L7/L12
MAGKTSMKMNRLLALGLALGLGAAVFTNSPTDAAAEGPRDAIELGDDADKDGPCKTESRWIKGLKGACDDGGIKKAKKFMKKLTKKCKKAIKKADGAKAAAKFTCDACHIEGDNTKLVGDKDKIDAIKARCADVDW